MLESVLRNCDGKKVGAKDVRDAGELEREGAGARGDPVRRRAHRAAGFHRRAAARRSRGDAHRGRSGSGSDPKMIEPLVPVDLVVDHSVQVDFAGSRAGAAAEPGHRVQAQPRALPVPEVGQAGVQHFGVVPPGIGIVHQVNLEYLAKGVLEKDGVYYPDTLVGTDSHTTMINGLGVVGWGVGGIEAEAGMLGQPVYFLTPEVVGVHLTGALREGVTATDLVLHITQMLRKAKVVGKFVEFYGEGAASLPVVDRATIAQHGAGIRRDDGLLPDRRRDASTYLRGTGRSEEQCAAFENYYRAQGLWGMPQKGEIDYSVDLELDLVDRRARRRRPEAPAGSHRAAAT